MIRISACNAKPIFCFGQSATRLRAYWRYTGVSGDVIRLHKLRLITNVSTLPKINPETNS